LFKPKDQIVYLPPHSGGDIHHPESEFGFIMSSKPEHQTSFCRFWDKNNIDVLRTRSCSELVQNHMLRECVTHTIGRIEFVYNAILEEQKNEKKR
jgi:hypothetical protein